MINHLIIWLIQNNSVFPFYLKAKPQLNEPACLNWVTGWVITELESITRPNSKLKVEVGVELEVFASVTFWSFQK